MRDSGLVTLRVTVESMRLELLQIVSEKLSEKELKQAIDAAVTPEALKLAIGEAIGEALKREAESIAAGVVFKNKELKQYMEKACKDAVAERMKYFE